MSEVVDVVAVYFGLILFGVALIITIGFTFLSKRKTFKVPCCHGLPGPVVPVNLLDNYNNRFGYCLGFGVLASSFVNLIVNPSNYDTGNSNLNILVVILLALQYGIISYPLFYCQQPGHKAIGTIVGFFYCIFWFSFKITIVARTFQSIRKEKTLSFILFMVFLPELLCLLLLAIRFLVICIKAIMYKSWDRAMTSSNNTRNFSIFYTKTLFLRRVQEFGDNKGLKWRIKKLLYVWKPEFRYSTRIACTFFICYVGIYLLFFTFLQLSTSIASRFPSLGRSSVVKDIWYASAILATLRSFLVLFHMMCCYKKQITKLRRGDRSWLPNFLNTDNASPVSAIRGSMIYSGLQIGFSIFGWFSAFFVIFGFLILFRFFLPSIFLKYWSFLLITICLSIFQYLSVKCFFVQERGRILALDNRSAYHIFAYFFFFYNIFIGLFTSLKRMVYTILIHMLLMEKLEWTTLPGFFQRLDDGYRAYLGYLLSENAHANPVMRTFLFCLEDCLVNEREEGKDPEQTTTSEWKQFSNTAVDKDQENEIKKTPKTVRNRWQLALLLHHNPSLIASRKHNLSMVNFNVEV